MEFFTEEGGRRSTAKRTFRTHIVGNLLALVVFGSAFVGGIMLLARASDRLPGLSSVVVVPVGLVLGAIVVLAGSTMAGSLFASLQPTNWLARLGPESLELNLRSWRYARPGDEARVVRIPLRNAVAMRRVKETWTETRGDRLRRFKRQWIELDLSGVDTAPLARAVDEERDDQPRATTLLGFCTKTRHHHDTVVVPRQGRLWIEWSGGLYRDLKSDVPVEKGRVERFGLQPGLAEHLEARLASARRAA